MSVRYLAAVALTLAALLCVSAAAAKVPRHRPKTPPSPRPAVLELYSQRELRKARIILQLKLLELREQRLERVRRAVERSFSPNPKQADCDIL
jgi:hypothetical protein